MTPLQILIVQALQFEQDFLTVPAIVHRMPNGSDQRFSLVNKEARALVSEGILIWERKGSAAAASRPSGYKLSPAMRESLNRRLNNGT